MRAALVCLLVVAAPACFRTTIINSEPAAKPAAIGVTVKHGFIHGLIEHKALDVDRACPGGGQWLAIEEQVTALNALLLFATMGLYTPRAVHVYCPDAPSPPASPGR